MNFLGILITSLQYFYKKSMGTSKENFFFDVRDLRVKNKYKETEQDHFFVLMWA